MIILGIDPGFGKLGYALIESDGNITRIIDCSCVETSGRESYEKRLMAVGNKTKNLISKHKPKAIAFEKVFFAKNQKTAMEIAEVRGVLRYLAALAKTPVREYTPLEVKMALTGYGRAPKEQVQKMLKLLLKIKSLPKSDDACDALAIGITCAVCLANSRLANKL
ncbi:MAG: crossover junction endodeoxyribonuclease RuvC [Candidatus Tagabacteria bacterium RIFCSPLOWO2_01_FULL_42_9]|uniref:Crossover junction endodeoxyribonuclease RuvC n=1 Tax=Candidatus Tagabacteria bacterium RIFCSPLOWO2_01_FULL_42_9 TaxID=1802296 RepID=A0A1G2LVX4_9BACT|nr:MAG: crossover junction endodeoxyribonuclease RuvC [Candidatus Tagabacteria bacterium RIFCSPLOWO2_01_FULL_42_9]